MCWRKSKLIANVIEDKCCNCRCCEKVCPHKVLESSWVLGRYVTFVNHPERCTGCGKCVEACPEDAVELIKRYC